MRNKSSSTSRKAKKQIESLETQQIRQDHELRHLRHWKREVERSIFWKIFRIYVYFVGKLRQLLRFIWEKLHQSWFLISNYGFGFFFKEVGKFGKRKFLHRRNKYKRHAYHDVLFISGCHGAPMRYRCWHQREQLIKMGKTADVKMFDEIHDPLLVKYYDTIILYRVPITPMIKKLVEFAKVFGKSVVYDIDDWVFEEEGVRKLRYIEKLSRANKKIYFDGVERMKKTLKLCEFGVGSTKLIVEKMKKYVDETFLSENAVSEEMVDLAAVALRKKKRSKKKIVLGYFSGSKTHDYDFEIVAPVIRDLFEQYPMLRLRVVGYLKLPKFLKKYRKRIKQVGFVNWKKLPKLIAKVDINLVPLEPRYFNEAKSAIKVMEAGLLEVPSVTSDLPVYRKLFAGKRSGLIARSETDWLKQLKKLIDSSDLRLKMGKRIREQVIFNRSTMSQAASYDKLISSQRRKKVTFIVPGTRLSGGIAIVMKHAQYLQGQGMNVVIVTQDRGHSIDWYPRHSIPVVPSSSIDPRRYHTDVVVATMWNTCEEALLYKAEKRLYLVQNFENRFYSRHSRNYRAALRTYRDKRFEIVTVAECLQSWLKNEFGRKSELILNGIDLDIYKRPKRRRKNNRPAQRGVPLKREKFRILLEGNPETEWKNMKEALKIVAGLEDAEVWMVSYGDKMKRPKVVDRFFRQVPMREMRDIYQKCDLLLKTSEMESFYLPPLEMMACGGVCVVADIPGGKDYLRDGENVLSYELGDIYGARRQIERLRDDWELRRNITKAGLATARSFKWAKSLRKFEKLLV